MRYPAQRAFSHVWSLCVEEQFYLVLPLLLALLLRRPSPRRAAIAVAAVVLAGIAWRGWVFFHLLRPLGPAADNFGSVYIERIYYPLPSRMDGLLAGACLATAERFRPAPWAHLQRLGWPLFAGGAAAIALSCRLFSGRFSSVSASSAAGSLVGFPLLAAGLAAMVMSALGNGPLGRWKLPGAAPAATLAYSLYLTHKAVLHLCADRLPESVNEGTWTGALIFLLASMAVAALLFYAVERPCLRLRDRNRTRPAEDPRRSPAL